MGLRPVRKNPNAKLTRKGAEATNESVISTMFKIMEKQQLAGKKFDQEKADLSLLPYEAKQGIARAFMDGEKKYGRYNYKEDPLDWSRLLAAADRHISAFNNGEDCASDSKLNHLWHAGANIMMLIEYYEKGLGNDNRYKETEVQD